MAETSKSMWRGQVRVILFVVLGLMIVAALYDKYGAKPKVEAAAKRIDEANHRIATTGESPVMTRKDVQEAVGIPFSRVEKVGKNNEYTMEVYSWRRGLPWMTYDLYALYRAGDRFESHFKYQDPRDEVMGYPEGAPGGFRREAIEAAKARNKALGIKSDDDEGEEGDEEEEEEEEEEEGGRRGPPDFSELDANGDGSLAGEELSAIPERFRDRLLEAADTNKDGAISKEEFDSRPRRGGPGPQGQRPASQPESGQAVTPPAGQEVAAPAAEAAEEKTSPAASPEKAAEAAPSAETGQEQHPEADAPKTPAPEAEEAAKPAPESESPGAETPAQTPSPEADSPDPK